MKAWLYKWLPITFGCHCRDDRSFHYHGEKFPICARCTGELVGMICSIFSCFFFRTTIPVALLLMLPLIIDGFVQHLTSYESTNPRRFVTGLLFGYGLVMFFVVTSILAVKFGIQIGENLKTKLP